MALAGYFAHVVSCIIFFLKHNFDRSTRKKTFTGGGLYKNVAKILMKFEPRLLTESVKFN